MKRTILTTPAFLAAFVCLLVGAIGLQVAIARSQVVLRKLPIYAKDNLPLRTLPASVPGWERVGQDSVLSKEVLEELGTENYLSRVYTGQFEGRPVFIELHAAYYTGMIDTVPHVPERCFVGGGMVQAGGTRIVPIPLDLERFSRDPFADPDRDGIIYTAIGQDFQSVRMPRAVESIKLRVTPFRDVRSGRKVHAGYFFLANGGWAVSANQVRDMAFDLRNDYAYYAKVQFTSWDFESAEDLARAAGAMLDELFPELMRRMPDWIEVMEGRYPPDNPRSNPRT